MFIEWILCGAEDEIFSSFSRVQETDGSFFESYSALAWKQESRIRQFAQMRNRQDEVLPSERDYITTSASPGAWLPADIRQNHKEVSLSTQTVRGRDFYSKL